MYRISKKVTPKKAVNTYALYYFVHLVIMC